MKKQKFTEPSLEIADMEREDILLVSDFMGDGNYDYEGAEWLEW